MDFSSWIWAILIISIILLIRIWERENPPRRWQVRLFPLVRKPPPRRFSRRDPSLYYQGLERHANDPENVHDSSVIRSLKRKYERLVELSQKSLSDSRVPPEDLLNSTLIEIECLIKKHFAQSPDEAEKCLKFLQESDKGRSITSLTPDFSPVFESRILVLVWTRIHQEENRSNWDKLERALLDQLIDATRKATPCITGRIGHLFAALTLLDADPILSEPERDDREIANLVFYKANSIVDHQLLNWVPAGGIPSRPIAQLYITDPDELSTEEKEIVEEFIAHCQAEIETTIRKEFADQLSAERLDHVIHEAKLGVR
jgi:hypothetical protein